jgi:hypothetical protein
MFKKFSHEKISNLYTKSGISTQYLLAMKERLSSKLYNSLCSISHDDWERLYPEYPDSVEIIKLIQDSGFEGFDLYSIVISLDNKPIIHMPLFKTSYNISNFLSGWVQKVINKAGIFLPKIFRPTVLGVGFVESEWSQIGVDQDISKSILDEGWDLALKSLETLSGQINANIVSFINFNAESIMNLPLSKMDKYSSILITPYAVLNLDYENLEEYTASLSKKMYKYIDRKTRIADSIRVINTRDPSKWIDEIYEQYLFMVSKSEIEFAVHSKYYFENICKYSQDTGYLLFFAEDKLLGFKLFTHRKGILVDKYLGMNPDIALKYNLFFISWMEIIKYCISKGIKACLQGPTGENVKRELGCKLIPGLVIFKFNNQMIQKCLELLRPYLCYHPEFDGSISELEKLKAERRLKTTDKGAIKC